MHIYSCMSTQHHLAADGKEIGPLWSAELIHIESHVPRDGGCSLKDSDRLLRLLLKGCTSVPPAALLLIILLSSVSTHFKQESSRGEIFFPPLQCHDGLLWFSFPWIYWSLRDLPIIACSSLGWSLSSLLFWWLVLFVWILSRMFFNYVFVAF